MSEEGITKIEPEESPKKVAETETATARTVRTPEEAKTSPPFVVSDDDDSNSSDDHYNPIDLLYLIAIFGPISALSLFGPSALRFLGRKLIRSTPFLNWEKVLKELRYLKRDISTIGNIIRSNTGIQQHQSPDH